MRAPEACESLADVRAEIDAIDQQVIALLGRRFGYVRAAARFKRSPDEVQAVERQRAMFAERRAWATAAGLDPDVIEQMYRDLVRYFAAQELEHWQADR